MRLTQQMWEPGKVYSFGGKDNTYAEKDLNEPPALDKKNLMAAILPQPDEQQRRLLIGAEAQSLGRVAAVREFVRGGSLCAEWPETVPRVQMYRSGPLTRRRRDATLCSAGGWVSELWSRP
ncbi:hypothetical protein [Streptomyces sp. NPDC056948]|uniref:hypothetical protein n=1 Tax=Streptomyces sp. NPDC056948 TaxID=3345975 RepID=UPI003628BD64